MMLVNNGNVDEYDRPPPPYNQICSVPLRQSPSPAATYRDNRLNQNQSNEQNRNRNGNGPRQICCCGSKTWAESIALIEIIICLMGLSMKLFALSLSDQDRDRNRNYNYGHGTTFHDAENDITFVRYTRYMSNSNPEVLVFEVLIGLVSGCTLYAGAHYGKPVLLLIWLVMEGITVALLGTALVILVFNFLFLGGGILVLGIIMGLLIPIGICSFCFYVVSLHRRELIDQRVTMDHSAVQLQSVHVINANANKR